MLVVLPSQSLAQGKYALLVGVERYAPPLPDLDYGDDDIRSIQGSLETLGFKVKTMTGEDKIPGHRPTGPDLILEQIDEWLVKPRKPGDKVVLAFSGHGVQVTDEKGRSEPCFCPIDAQLGEPATLLPFATVFAKLEECPARDKLLLVDCCRTIDQGRENPRAVTGDFAKAIAQAIAGRRPAGVLALFSCREGEKSYEDATLKNGVFSHFVIRYLQGQAPAFFYKNRSCSVEQMILYVSEETRDLVRLKFNESQHPERVLPPALFADWDLGKLPNAAALPPLPAHLDITRNTLGMPLVLIPGGEFRMGSGEPKSTMMSAGLKIPDDPEFTTADEMPKHDVRITRPFRMGVHEVTVGEFRQFYDNVPAGSLDSERDRRGGRGFELDDVDDPAVTARRRDRPMNPRYTPFSWGHPQMISGNVMAPRYPVVNVSWNDAVAFCNWLSRKEGLTPCYKRQGDSWAPSPGANGYRLPTEAEWEYACRGRTQTRFWQGNDPETLPKSGNVADGSLRKRLPAIDWGINGQDGWEFTAPVGQFDPNPFGLHDMHGNVCEWCSDWYDKDYYRNSPPADPQGPPQPPPEDGDGYRVIRGGGWYLHPADCRSAYRHSESPTYRDFNLGFRVVRDEPAK